MKFTKQDILKWGSLLTVLVLGVGGWSLWSQRQQSLQATMSDRLYSVRAGWTAERQEAKVSEFKKAQAQTLYPKTIASLEGIDRDGGSSRAAQEARLWLAQIYLRHGQAELARPIFERASAHAKGSLEKGLSLQGLAAAWESEGKLDEALKVLDRAITVVDSSIQGEILLNVARVAAALGQKERAVKTLTQIIEKHPATEWAQEAQRMKSSLSGSEGAVHG